MTFECSPTIGTTNIFIQDRSEKCNYFGLTNLKFRDALYVGSQDIAKCE